MGQKKFKKHGQSSGDVTHKNTKTCCGGYSKMYISLLLTIAIVVAFVHKKQLSFMFESDRHFSHLSSVERELTFRTEMGFYYSYYKTIVEAPSFVSGLQSLLRDNITEYPDTINTLKRFNLYPEVVTGAIYRGMKSMNLFSKVICYNVERGDGKSSLQSCEGLGVPIYFYVESIFCLNGIHAGIFFLYATYLSGSIVGGLLSISSFFFNHSEMTRVQWTPPLRESFGFPLFFIQMFAVTYILRKKAVSFAIDSLTICVPLVCFMCSWQFAQFSTLTQVLSVFVVYACGGIDNKKFSVIIVGIGMGLLISFVLLFGNIFILNSLLSTSLISLLVIVGLSSIFEKINCRIVIMFIQFVILITVTLAGKYFIGRIFNISDDAHIAHILKSKFTDFRNFDTMLYTCAAEFDFMPIQAIYPLTYSLLLPVFLISTIVVGVTTVRFIFKSSSFSEEDLSPKSHPEILYNILQCLSFVAMAVMIMRLKVFMMPHLNLLMCLISCNKVYSFLPRKRVNHIIVVILAIMSFSGIPNLKTELSIQGEFSNDDFVDCLDFIDNKLPENAVFAGAMATMATIKLVTGRPIVNHPHYEHADLRKRTKLAYTTFSRKPLKEVHANLKILKAEYVLLENGMCRSKAKPNCTLAEIFDMEDETNRNGMKTCERLMQIDDSKKARTKKEKLFLRIYSNVGYEIYKIL